MVKAKNGQMAKLEEQQPVDGDFLWRRKSGVGSACDLRMFDLTI